MPDPLQDPDVRHPRPCAHLTAMLGQDAASGEEPAERRPDRPHGRRRRSPAGRSPARPSPAAATGASTGSPPGVAAERDSGRPPSRGLARSPGRIASSRARSGGPVRRGAGAIGSCHAPGVPRSPAGGRASRAAAGGRARPSGRQALATAGPACGQDAASARRLHTGAEAVFLGAVALLGLVGLLHRACAGSSPSGLGVRPSSTPEGTQTRRSPDARAGRVQRPADDRSRASRASNVDGARREADAFGRRLGAAVAVRCDTPGEYRGFALRGPGGGAMFRHPKPRRPGRSAPSPSPRFACPICPAATSSTVPGTQRVHIDLWTRSRSGAPPSASSRSPSRPRTSRPGCATPRSSRSTTRASGSRSRTASPRTGWRAATAR